VKTIDAIKTRRSFRRYLKKDVDNAIIRELIEAASFAPSAHNFQPWEFIITKDQSKKEEIANASTYAKFLPDAPVAIIVCTRKGKTRKVDDKELLKHFSIQDSAAAIQNLMLAAHEKGLATCWIGDLQEDRLRGMFNIPEDIYPVAIIPLGYPEPHVMPAVPKRRPIDEILHFEQF